MRLGTILLVIWLIIGAVAAGQRHYFGSSGALMDGMGGGGHRHSSDNANGSSASNAQNAPTDPRLHDTYSAVGVNINVPILNGKLYSARRPRRSIAPAW